MAGVDRNVLRLGTAELLTSAPDAPAAVVINESIELARRYGAKDSPAFVNGVLDKVKELRTSATLEEVQTPAAASPAEQPQTPPAEVAPDPQPVVGQSE
jgi:N utilization substance protein B